MTKYVMLAAGIRITMDAEGDVPRITIGVNKCDVEVRGNNATAIEAIRRVLAEVESIAARRHVAPPTPTPEARNG